MALIGWGNRHAEAGGRLGSGVLLVTVAAALILCAVVVMERMWRDRKRGAILISNPSGLLEPIRAWPGVRWACGAVGLALILLVCFQLVVPFEASCCGSRTAAALRSAAALGCACAILVQVGRSWSVALAGIALGLLTLAVCTVATTVVPEGPRELARRSPWVFSAIVFALGLMTWFWAWLAEVWEQQLEEATERRSNGATQGKERDEATEGRSDGATKGKERDEATERRSDGGSQPEARARERGHEGTKGRLETGTKLGDRAWTTAGRLIPVSRRLSAVAGISGWLVAGLMAVWPVLRAVSAQDDSPGRVSAGVAAHVVLLLASLRCARSAGRAGFRILSVLVLLSMVTFVVVRARSYIG